MMSVERRTKTAGEEFASILATKNPDRLRAMFADSLDFRALTPNNFWEAETPRQLVDEILYGQWFEPTDHIQGVTTITTGRVADREHVAYRLRINNPGGNFIVEQQAYYTTNDGKIDWMRILCTGFRPAATVS